MNNRSKLVDTYLAGITDWRGELLVQLRECIHQATPDIIEELKWDVPVFIHKKMICAISAFKDHVKINFFKGASLKDPQKLFNNGLTSKQHRSIDFSQGNEINKNAVIELVKEAVTLT